MKVCLILLAFACAAHGYITNFVDVNGKVVVNQDVVLKQKVVFDVLRHVHSPLTVPSLVGLGKTFVVDELCYTDVVKYKEWLDVYVTKVLTRGEVFSVMNKYHLHQVKGLFNLFYFSKDWVTLKQNIVWARMHVNVDMFVHALVATVIHRPDFNGVVIPAIYEILPYKFLNNYVITDAVHGVVNVKWWKDDVNVHVVWDNKTHVNNVILNKDDKLRYFTEDVALNTWYFFTQLDIGFWLSDKVVVGLDKVNRGEKYLFVHQQLLARYYLERLSNDLGDISEFEWNRPIVTGYFSNLRYYNGLVFPTRHNNYLVKQNVKRDVLVVKVLDIERRLRDVVDKGYLVLNDGHKVDLRDPKSVDVLGKVIVGCPDCVDVQLYKSVEVYMRVLLSGGIWTGDVHHVIPGVLEHFETSLRDPVMYMMIKRIIKIWWLFKDNLKPYTKDELVFKGVVIENVTVNKLVTYMDYTDVDVTNVLDIPVVKKSVDVVDTHLFVNDVVKVRTTRLNHNPIKLDVAITSDKDVRVVVRTFLGPKYDEWGHVLTVKDNRENWVLLDKYVTDVKVGKNVVTRWSRDFLYTIPDTVTWVELYKNVMTWNNVDFVSKNVVDFKDTYCGFPDRLVLPKGKVNGLPLQLFVVVTPVTVDRVKTENLDVVNKLRCGTHVKLVDDFSMGWPFDRKIVNDYFFLVKNMFVKDVYVFHHVDDVVDVNRNNWV